MRNTETKYKYMGTPLCTILTIIFVVLKLCNVINWSWWFVFAPIWIPSVFITVSILIVILFFKD